MAPRKTDATLRVTGEPAVADAEAEALLALKYELKNSDEASSSSWKKKKRGFGFVGEVHRGCAFATKVSL